MREIKFRAWNDGKMIYNKNNDINHNHFQLSWFFDKIEDNAIVMQFTGLKDKNGVEIYEGDILQFSDKLEWYKSDVRWIFNNFERSKEIIESILNDHIKHPYERREIKIPECYEWLLSDEIQIYWEVIGNVFENPELLEE